MKASIASSRDDVGAGLDLAAAIGVEGGLREDLAGQAHAGAHLGPVVGMAHVVEEDARMLVADRREASRTQPRLFERIGPTWAWKPCSVARPLPS